MENSEQKQLLEVIYGDTDSLYISYENLLQTIEGIENMSDDQICKILVELNTGFLDQHNREFMDEYFRSRHAKSIQNFELETIAKSGVWLDVKKRYAQILMWKDGKMYDADNLPMKIKGLEMVKASIPKQARESLKRLTRFLLENNDPYMLQQLNIQMQKEKALFMQAPLEDICGSIGVQNYTKYILSDTDPTGLKVAPKCPFNVRALGNYNRIRNIYNLPGDPLYGGKMRWYLFYPGGRKSKKKADPDYFAFQASNYPAWADQYAPVSRVDMFQHFVIDPFNRIIGSSNIGQLKQDGSIQTSMF